MDAGLLALAGLVTAAAFAGGAFVGSAAGFVVGRRERAVAALVDGRDNDGQADACGCGHHQSFHRDGKRACWYRKNNHTICSCQFYVKHKSAQSAALDAWADET